MKVDQISIFLENKSGRLAEVTRVLGNAGINVRALSLADTSDFGILRLIVNDSAKAVEVLKQSQFTVSMTQVVAVEVPDRPGGLAHILDILQKENINVEYMYGFVEKFSEKALLVFRFDDPVGAHRILTSAGITVISEKDIPNL